MVREAESGRRGVYELSDEERTAVRAGMEDARRGDFASEDEIEGFYQLHRQLSSLRGA
jgi:predicted transcriptional regulator